MRMPCINNCIFQKNHDWNLNLEIKKNERLIVLYRSNIEKQLNSFYRHNTNKSILIKNSDVIDYLNFFNEKKKYYNRFINKWIENSNKNILGMMPHPERMVDEMISNKDGVNLFSSLLN